LSEEIIKKAENIIRTSEKLGASEAEILTYSFDDSSTRFTRSLIDQSTESKEQGAYIKIVNKNRCYAEAFIKSTEEETIAKVISDLLEHAKSGANVPFTPSSKIPPMMDTFIKRTAELTTEERAETAKLVIQTAHSISEKITKVAGAIATRVAHLALVNTSGLSLAHSYTGCSIICTPLAEDCGSLGVGFASQSSRDFSEIDVRSVAEESAREAVLSLNPKPIDLGRYYTIFQPDAAGDIVGSFIQLGFSTQRDPHYIQSDSICASDLLTVTDEPHNLKTLMPIPFDFEGTPTTSLTFIEKGIAKEKCYDKGLALQENRSSTGHAPFPHDPTYSSKFFPGWVYYPTNQIVQGAQATKWDIIKDVKRAILVKRLMYAGLPMGMSTGLQGRDIMQAHTMGTWLIEDGQIKNALPCLRLSDSLNQMVKKIEVIGDISSVKKLGCINTPWLAINDVLFTEISSLAVPEGMW
jgi:predicted Zn-dependent protease